MLTKMVGATMYVQIDLKNNLQNDIEWQLITIDRLNDGISKSLSPILILFL
jgi:hypothetical protein